MKDLINDSNGKPSPKRKLGIRAMNMAFIMAGIYFFIGITMSILKLKFDYKFPFDIWISILGIGASLLGITLVERFSKK